jgi:uncharacterized protein YkwD
MSTTARPRTRLRALHVTVMVSLVGLTAVACAPAGTPAATGAPDAAVTAVTAPSTTAPTAAAPGPSAPTTATPLVAPEASTTTTATPLVVPGSTPPVAAAAIPSAPSAPASTPPAPMAVVLPAAAPAVTASPGDGVQAQAARALFDATNSFRQQNGVPAVVWSDALQRSAHQHNLAMAAANLMTHQAPGEASFDTRISDQGVPWLSVGENVGFNTDRTVAGALALHTTMINEVAPNDDHKVNKLDPLFTTLGVDVYLDAATGKLWLTEDYAQI